MQNILHNKNNIPHGIFFTILLGALYSISYFNFLLFHSLSEIFSIVIAFSIFTITWHSKKYFDNNYFLFIGISCFFTGTIDLFHTFTFKGIEIIPGYDANLSTQLWIMGRFIEAVTFIVAPLFIKKKLNINLLFLIYVLTSFLFLLLAFTGMFPVCYIEGKGLTVFKKVSEYVISCILISSIILLFRKYKFFDKKIFILLVFAVVSKIFSEMFFTLYLNIYEHSNAIGHLFKIISFYLFYIAIVQMGIEKPYQLIFRELKENEEKLSAIALTDELTGLFNRRACYEYLRKMMAQARRENGILSICLIDLDNLKAVNDNFGHSQGDVLLKTFADILKKYTRDSDYICRIGGDEFLLIFANCSQKDAGKYIRRMKEGVEVINRENRKYNISFSYGLAGFSYKSRKTSIDKMIEIVDKKMYKDKALKKRVV